MCYAIPSEFIAMRANASRRMLPLPLLLANPCLCSWPSCVCMFWLRAGASAERRKDA